MFIHNLNRVRPRSLSPGGGLGGSGFWPFFPAPFFGLLTFPFILACIPYPTSTCGVRLSRTDTCPISPYPEWLEVVVKAEEYGPVKCRVLNGSKGSFPFVLGRYTIQRTFLYWPRYFRFFPKLFLYRFCPSFQGDLGYAEDRIILGCVSRLFGLLLPILGYNLPRLGLWAPM